jgi:two-component system, OmpR family, response regulator
MTGGASATLPNATPRKLIYVVEDDRDARDLACGVLEDYGFQPQGFRSGRDALRGIERQSPDLCLVDLGLPDMDGLSLVRALCDDVRFGVIILTGRADVSDRVLGLELGADDYILKPYEPRELVARVNSFLRRRDLLTASGGPGGKTAAACFAGWRYDPADLSLVHDDGRTESLSRSEAALLGLFLRAPRRVLSREHLQGDDGLADDVAFDRSIDVRISRLRKKLGDDPRRPGLIKTVYGAGYLFTADVVWAG